MVYQKEDAQPLPKQPPETRTTRTTEAGQTIMKNIHEEFEAAPEALTPGGRCIGKEIITATEREAHDLCSRARDAGYRAYIHCTRDAGTTVVISKPVTVWRAEPETFAKLSNS